MIDAIPRTARIVDLRTGLAFDYWKLLASVDSRVTALSEHGLTFGGRLAIAEKDPIRFVTDLFAAWAVGAVVLCLPSSLTAEERANVTERVKPDLWASDIPHVIDRSTVGKAEDLYEGNSVKVAPASMDDAALILMTSGTTGHPKGVVHTHRSLRSRIALNISQIGKWPLRRTLDLLPLHFGHGLIGNTLTPLLSGGTLFAFVDPGVDGLGSLGKIIDENEVTFMSSVPAMWQVALRLSPPPEKRTLERIHVGSAPLSTTLWRQIIDWVGTQKVVNTYGITEAANWIGGADASECEPVDNLVGRPWDGAMRVRTDSGKVLSSGSGEVMISTTGLMAGYLDEPDRTASVMQGGWFLTGDRGEIGADGMLRLVGRRKNEINRAGIKISAEEIDLLLERHPLVREACAFAIDDPVSGETVAAAVVLEAEAIEPEALVRWCEERIRREAVPAKIFVVEELARSDRGKINRDLVRDMAVKG